MRSIIFLGAALCLAACNPSSADDAQSVTIDLPPAVPVDSINVAGADGYAEPAPQPPPAPLPLKPKPASATPKAEQQPPEPAADPNLPQIVPSAGAVGAVDRTSQPAASASPPPISAATIARTLGRIGFACGQVVATDSVEAEGESPAWRIACSSGASYRATSRSGHMRFSRW